MADLGSMQPDDLATVMLDSFYGPETSLQGDRSADIETVTDLLTYLGTVPQTGENGQAVADQGPAVFMGACAAVLSSAEFYLY